MSVHLLQVTIASPRTQFSATTVNVSEVIIQADDGNSNPAFIGDVTVTTANGIRLHNSATVPEEMTIGPQAAGSINLADLYVAGTNDEKVNVLYTKI